jgi:hypothetical protein
MMNKLKVLLLVTLFSVSANANNNANNNTTLNLNKECTVDSTIYEAYPQDGYRVPFIDGTKLSINIKASQLDSVLVEGQSFFRKCHQDLMEIETADMAKNAFQYTGETDFDQFVGLNVGMCNTVDEGWMILVGEQDYYLGYMGPYEVVLSLVSLKCADPAQP